MHFHAQEWAMVRWGGARVGGIAPHDPSAWAARLWAFLLAFLYGLLEFARYCTNAVLLPV